MTKEKKFEVQAQWNEDPRLLYNESFTLSSEAKNTILDLIDKSLESTKITLTYEGRKLPFKINIEIDTSRM